MGGEVDLTAARAWQGRSVLVTGASGFVGRAFTAQAVEAGACATGISRSLANRERVSRAIDLRDRDELAALVAEIRPEAVVHLAAAGLTAGAGSKGALFETNVMGLDNLLSACRDLQIAPSVVVVGSGFEYLSRDRPLREDDLTLPSVNDYGAAKAAATSIAASYRGDLPITVLRPFNIYGPGEAANRLGPSLMNAALAGTLVPLTPGEQTRDFLHVADFCRSIWMALSAQDARPGFSLFNVGTGIPISVKSYVKVMSCVLAKHGLVLDAEMGALPYRAREPMVYVPDTESIAANLGFRAEIGLEAGLDSLCDYALAR